MNKFADMSFEEVRKFARNSRELSELSDGERMQLEDTIAGFGVAVGYMLDKVKGIDPYAGKPRRYGTTNRRSYAYKLRKALGYTYP
jgi:hypothetical protein